jgi:hypothetical protein
MNFEAAVSQTATAARRHRGLDARVLMERTKETKTLCSKPQGGRFRVEVTSEQQGGSPDRSTASQSIRHSGDRKPPSGLQVKQQTKVSTPRTCHVVSIKNCTDVLRLGFNFMATLPCFWLRVAGNSSSKWLALSDSSRTQAGRHSCMV